MQACKHTYRFPPFSLGESLNLGLCCSRARSGQSCTGLRPPCAPDRVRESLQPGLHLPCAHVHSATESGQRQRGEETGSWEPLIVTQRRNKRSHLCAGPLVPGLALPVTPGAHSVGSAGSALCGRRVSARGRDERYRGPLRCLSTAGLCGVSTPRQAPREAGNGDRAAEPDQSTF